MAGFCAGPIQFRPFSFPFPFAVSTICVLYEMAQMSLVPTK